MLCALRKQKFPELTIEYTFPIHGHSFLPADRAFGRIEQDIRKKETVILPEECISILRKHGSVHIYDQDWVCQDFKEAAACCCLSQRSFKISDARVLRLDNDYPDKVAFKQVYGGDFCHHGILNRGKKLEQFKSAISLRVNCVKPAKKAN